VPMDCARHHACDPVILFYFFTSTRLARARAKFGIAPPAIAGHPDFERVFRVQINRLEWLPIFLPSLWLFAIYVSDARRAVCGPVWIIGRIVYMFGYEQAGGQAPHRLPCAVARLQCAAVRIAGCDAVGIGAWVTRVIAKSVATKQSSSVFAWLWLASLRSQ